MEAVMEPTVGTTSDTGRDSPDPKDLMLKISVGNSRKAGTWNPMEISKITPANTMPSHLKKLRAFISTPPFLIKISKSGITAPA